MFSSITTYLNPDGIDHVKIYFAVREIPNIVRKVTFLGAKHIKPEDLRNITGVRPITPINPNLNRRGCRKILEKYAEMRRSFADCQLVNGGHWADTEVVYRITEGPKVTVRDIKFVGDFSFVSAASLAVAQAKSSQKWFPHIGEIYNKQRTEAEVAELCQYLRNFGYLDVRISLESQRSADGSEVTLIFHIQEGPRYRIHDVPEVQGCIQDMPDAHGSKEIPTAQLIALCALKPGLYFDAETLKQDIKAITNYMFQCGRAVRVDAFLSRILTDTPAACNVRYYVMELAFRIGKIHVRGNKRISSESILAHVPLRPGEILSASDAKQAEKNLTELGLFVVDAARGVRPTITVTDSDEDGNYTDLLITVKEKPKAKPKRTKPGE